MKKVNLGPPGEGPYSEPRRTTQGEQITRYQCDYLLRVFVPEPGKPADKDKKPVAIFSDLRENFAELNGLPLENILAAEVQKLMKKLGLEKPDAIDVIHHVPENAAGKNVEVFERVTFLLDSVELTEHYRNPRFDLSAHRVAQLVGLENFESLYQAYDLAEITAQRSTLPKTKPLNLSEQEFRAEAQDVLYKSAEYAQSQEENTQAQTARSGPEPDYEPEL